MYWREIVAALAGFTQIASIVPYIRDMFVGTTRPNVVSYFIWTLLQGIAIAAQISAGASWSLVLPVAMTFNTTLIVILGLTGYGYQKYTRVDYTCLGLALIAIVAWQLTREPLLALVISLVADSFATVPTIMKAYLDPWSELPLGWFMVVMAAALSIVASTKFDLANMLYPVYTIIACSLIGGFSFMGQRGTLRE